mgnify:CR=1 FL=1
MKIIIIRREFCDARIDRKINERKIKLWIGLDGELHYRAPKGALSSGLAGEIRQNKVKIVEFLKRKVCERIVEVAERNDKIRVAEAKWGEEGLLLQVEPELIRQNYKYIIWLFE